MSQPVVHTSTNPIFHIGRMIVCLMTFGFAFPNAFAENIDPTGIDARFKDPNKKA